MNIVVIQCRLSSTRLPEKALLPIQGIPVIGWVMQSMKKVSADAYYLATDDESFEKLSPVASSYGFTCFAGPRDDVLERFCLLIEKTGAATVLRVTGDNPFLFYESAIQTLKVFTSPEMADCDYFTYTGLPHGSGVEIFSAKALLKARDLTTLPFEHEHVGPSLYNHPEHFKSKFEPAPPEWNYPHYRTTIDTAWDYHVALHRAKFLSSPATCGQIVEACKQTENLMLFVPSVKKGHGTGHLRRCLALAKELSADLYISPDADTAICADLLRTIEDWKICRSLQQKGEYSLIVADAFALEKNEAQTLSSIAPLMAIDEGSEYTEYCDYVLDIIPSLTPKKEINVQYSGFIPLPTKKRTPPKKIEKVLISIGGEDPAGLTVKTAKVFAECGYNVTAIAKKTEEQLLVSNVRFLEHVENLREKLFSYDLIVTHYGFTAFEAIAAGCAVMLVGTSDLHFQLGKKYGFAILDSESLTKTQVLFTLDNVSLFPDSEEMKAFLDRQQQDSLSEFILGIAQAQFTACPICAHLETERDQYRDKVIARFLQGTVRRCCHCGMLYLACSVQEKKTYKESYFFDEYKKQYGKTYLEDFASIKKQGVRRSTIIDRIFLKFASADLKNDASFTPTLLDIGCAYGPFLSAAKDAGWMPYGTDISAEAIEYVRSSLSFSAVQAAFPDFDSFAMGVKHFDAITMWFVIEHFQNLVPVLQKVNSLLKPGGVFAFSTPSAAGVSARFSEERFFASSPLDHFTLWEPKRAAAILSDFGFKVVKIVSTGHHPERFPFLKFKHKKMAVVFYSIFGFFSRVFKLGDTFEVYCIKKE